MLRQGLSLAAVGLVLAAAGAIGAGKLMQTLLFNVSPIDPATLIGVIVVMATVSVVACIIPALRATKVDPLTALRR